MKIFVLHQFYLIFIPQIVIIVYEYWEKYLILVEAEVTAYAYL